MGKLPRYALLAGLPVFCVVLSVAARQQQPASQTHTAPAVPLPSQMARASTTPASSGASAAVPSTTPSSSPASTARVTDFEPSTVLKATTRLVILDVVATDNRGNHITDLKASDFTVSENGKEQKVRAFGFQHPVSANQPSGAKMQTPKLPSNVFTNIPQRPPSSALNVLLLDALNTTTGNQTYARQQALKFLDKMPDNEPIAIFTLSSKLRMLQDFTSDSSVLKQVIKNYKGNVSVAMDAPSGGDEPEILPPGVFDGLPSDVQANLQLFETERTAAQLDMRTRMTMDALRAIAKILGGYLGRKNLIWVSEAFPLYVYPDSELGMSTFAGARNYDEDVVKTANVLMDAEVAVYPVGAAGLETVGFSADSRGTDKYGRSRTSAQTFSADLSRQQDTLNSSHGTMDQLAERTGGKAFYNRNDLDEVVRTSIEDGSTYYMLGYYPEDKNWNGKFRKIQVKVDRPGAKLRHRFGYYALEPQNYAKQDAKTRDAELGRALSLELPVSTTVTFVAAVVPPSSQTNNKLLINYNIDPHGLAFEGGGDGLQHADLECAAQAYSEKGKPIKFNGRTLAAALKPEVFKRILQEGFPCGHDLDLPAGKYLLRLLVRDDRTGLIGTANAKVTVPETASANATAGAGNKEEK